PAHLAPLPALAGGVETILVVEDEEAVRAATVDMLATLGYQVLSSADAEQATHLIDGGVQIDLLFTDVMMPGRVSSLELSELIRAKQPHAQILFTSGYAEGVLSHDGKLPPGVNLLQKPYTAETLSSRIRHLLRKRDATTGLTTAA
ncbi:MAG TPA: response regulator, partial [Duganella sp.]